MLSSRSGRHEAQPVPSNPLLRCSRNGDTNPKQWRRRDLPLIPLAGRAFEASASKDVRTDTRLARGVTQLNGLIVCATPDPRFPGTLPARAATQRLRARPAGQVRASGSASLPPRHRPVHRWRDGSVPGDDGDVLVAQVEDASEPCEDRRVAGRLEPASAKPSALGRLIASAGQRNRWSFTANGCRSPRAALGGSGRCGREACAGRRIKRMPPPAAAQVAQLLLRKLARIRVAEGAPRDVGLPRSSPATAC